MKTPLQQRLWSAGYLSSCGAVIVVGFFLPMVRGCDVVMSAHQIAQQSPIYYIYLASGALVLLTGLLMFKLSWRGLYYIASAAGAASLVHLLAKTFKEITGDKVEPLLGYFVLLASFSFATLYPWLVRRSIGRAKRYAAFEPDPVAAEEEGELRAVSE